jgi:hypothetical protein
LTWAIALSMAEVASGPPSMPCNCAQVTFSTSSLKLPPVRRDLGNVEAGIVGVVVEADVAHIDEPGLGRLVAVTG